MRDLERDGLVTANGAKWELLQSGMNNHAVLSLAVYPSAPYALFAGLDIGDVARSVDGGATWSSFSGDMTDGLSVYALKIRSGLQTTLGGDGKWRSLLYAAGAAKADGAVARSKMIASAKCQGLPALWSNGVRAPALPGSTNSRRAPHQLRGGWLATASMEAFRGGIRRSR